MIKSLMILAGGKGSRIKEYTRHIPKPLILANGKPLIQYIIDQYASFGVKNIYILGGYKIDEFIKYFQLSSFISYKHNGHNLGLDAQIKK